MKTLVAQTMQEALEKLDSAAGGQVILDFSAVRRIDPKALKAIEALIAAAHDKAVKIVLSAVDVDVYKVLKLMNLERQVSFV